MSDSIVSGDGRLSGKRLRPGVAVLAGVALVAMASPSLTSHARAYAAPSTAAADPVKLTRDAAFSIVYPIGQALVTIDGEAINVRFSPIALVRLDRSTMVLVSGGQNLDQNCHGCTGFFSIAYLGSHPGWTVEGSPYLGMGQTGGWGTPPEIAIIRSLSPEPMVLVRSGQSGQGSTESWGRLVRLGPTIDAVSVALDRFDISYDNDGSAADCSIKGKIIPGKRGRSFTIRYTGTYRGDVIYTSSGGPFTPVGGPPRDLWKRCPGMEDEE